MLLAACSRPQGPRRLAVLTFENLTGDPALDWISAAAPAIVSSELSALRVANLSDAYLDKATQIVHGYFTAGSRFEIQVEDASTHKLTGPLPYTGPLLTSMTAASKSIDPAAHDFSTTREDAVEAWGRHDFEKAVSIDPDFGPAWLAWVETLVQHGDASQASAVAERALARPALRSPTDRARIQLMIAHDAPARAAALDALAKLTHDPATIAALAESQLNARNFSAAAAAFQTALAADPANSPLMLSLGYAQSYAGLLDAAKDTFEKYGRQPGQKTNSLDSLGEAYFMNGKFAEAEKYFLAANQSDPSFLKGAEVLKAAYAGYLSGDVKGADLLAGKYIRDPWREASWYFSTGRSNQAIAKLQSVPDQQLVQKQLAVWNANLPTDLQALKTRYENTPPSLDGEVRTFYAAALLKAGRKDDAKKLVQLWPLPLEQGVDPLVESRVFPTFLAVHQAF